MDVVILVFNFTINIKRIGIFLDEFNQETFDALNPVTFQTDEGSAYKLELKFHVSRALGRINILERKELTESETSLVNYKEKYSEFQIIYQVKFLNLIF